MKIIISAKGVMFSSMSLIGWLVYGTVDWFVGYWVSWFVDWSTRLLVCWLVGLLLGLCVCLVGLMVDGSVGLFVCL